MDDLERFSRDPEALAWARARVQHVVDQARRRSEAAALAGDAAATARWRQTANFMARSLTGTGGFIIGAFDERLPGLLAQFDEVDWDQAKPDDPPHGYHPR